jgi:hypothetical protein
LTFLKWTGSSIKSLSNDKARKHPAYFSISQTGNNIYDAQIQQKQEMDQRQYEIHIYVCNISVSEREKCGIVNPILKA